MAPSPSQTSPSGKDSWNFPSHSDSFPPTSYTSPAPQYEEPVFSSSLQQPDLLKAWGGMNSVVITPAQHTLQMGRLRNSEPKKKPVSEFLFRQTDRPAVLQNKTFFPVLSVKPRLPHSAQPFSFVQSGWPLTWGLPAQFVSPLIMIIHYPTLHIKTHTGSSQTRELGGWAVGKKHNCLYKWCSRVSLPFFLSRRKRFLPLQILQK